jgi:hypothetical protein
MAILIAWWNPLRDGKGKFNFQDSLKGSRIDN